MKKTIYLIIAIICLSPNIMKGQIRSSQMMLGKEKSIEYQNNNIFVKEVSNGDTIYKYTTSVIQGATPQEDAAKKNSLKFVAKLENKNILNPEQQNNTLVSSFKIDDTKDVGEIPIQSNISNGLITYDVPIEIYEAAENVQPNITLSYRSIASNGIAGMGWDLGGIDNIEITHSNYYYDGINARAESTNMTSAYTLNGMRLIKTSQTSTYIKYETEQGKIIVKNYAPSGLYYFEVQYPDGRTGIFGYKTSKTATISYPLTRMFDRFGNYADYVYSFANNIYNITSISYGRSSTLIGKLNFAYTTRNDTNTIFRDGLEVKQDKLLSKIEVFFKNTLLRTYQLSYTFQDVNLLTKIGLKSNNRELNPLVFSYGSGYQNKSLDNSLNFLETFFRTTDIVLQKGKFSGQKYGDGLIAYPRFDTYGINAQGSGGVIWGSRYDPNQDLAVYNKLDYLSKRSFTLKAEDGFQKLFAADIDGDGNDELVKVNYWLHNSSQAALKVQIYKNNSLIKSNTFYLEGTFKHGKYQNHIPREFIWGDFNGDGKVELIAIGSSRLPDDTNRNYSTITVINLETLTTLYNTSSNPTNLVFDMYNAVVMPMDHNGDGKTDLCLINQSGTFIFDYINNKFELMSTLPAITHNTLANQCVQFGDFNGDGKTDLLVSPPLRQYPMWTYYYATGKGFNVNIGAINYYNPTHKYHVSDINGDGVDDLIISDSGKLTAYINKNGMVYNTTSSHFTLESDINFIDGTVSDLYWGSSSSQVLCIKDALVYAITYECNDGLERLLTSVTNSMGIRTTHTFGILGANTSFSSNSVSYPYARLSFNFNVLTGISVYDGYNRIDSKYYSYKDPTFHKAGLGFSGFGEISVNDYVKNTKSIQTYDPVRFGIVTSVVSPTNCNTNTRKYKEKPVRTFSFSFLLL